MPQRAWSITTSIDDHREAHTIFATTRGKAAYETLLSARECYPDLSFKDIKVHSLGVRDTPAEIAARQAAAFNAKFPPGTPVRVYPGLMGDHDSAYDTEIRAPGAEVQRGSATVWVRVPGDRIAIGHVVPLVPIAQNA